MNALKRVPLTAGLLVSLAVFFVAGWLVPGGVLVQALGFFSAEALSQPWTFLTFPWSPMPPGAIFFVILAGLWLWQMGSSLEYEKGWKTIAAIWLGASFVTALLMTLFAGAIGPVGLAGPWLPVSALTVYWCALVPKGQMNFLFFPVQRWMMAAITGAITLFNVGASVPLAGVLALVPLALLWFLGTRGWAMRKGSVMADLKAKKAEQAKFDAFYGDVRQREQERKEKEELRKLFERSLVTDPDDDEPQKRSK